MIRLLIISLHYPPDNIIAARRSEAYARHFHKFGIYPIIITDKYEKEFDNEGNWTGYKNHTRTEQPVTEEYETHCVIRLPRYITPLQQFQKFIEGIPLLSPLFTLLMYALGHFDMHLLGHYANYKRFLVRQLKTKKYDMILAVDSPHFHVRLAYKLNKKFRIPYVCDFRDLYDNSLLNKEYKPSFSKGLINYCKKRYFTRWLKNCMFLTSVSQVLVDYYSSISYRKGYEVTNGFEPIDYKLLNTKNSQVFQIASTGRLYGNQDWSVFSQGIGNFIEKTHPENFKVVFAGVRKDAEEIAKMIKTYIPEKYLKIYGWLDKEEIHRIQSSSSVLCVASWQGTVGVYSGKIFEYLGARRPILFAPGDEGGVVDQLLAQTGAGISANTPEEVCSFITEKYNEWKQTGRVSYQGKEEEIIKYTRENQVRKMAGLIRGTVENGG